MKYVKKYNTKNYSNLSLKNPLIPYKLVTYIQPYIYIE